LAMLSLQGLRSTIDEMKADNMYGDTKLKLDLVNRNPDDGVTDIAYNKGYFFLRAIEEKYGRDKFDMFVKDYFNEHAFQSMDTERFVTYLKEYYQSKNNIAIDDAFINAWIYTEGLPADVPKPQSSRFKNVEAFIADWQKSGKLDPSAAAEWSTHEWLHFLKNLPENLSLDQMKALDTFGKFTATRNSEIATQWMVLAIRYGYHETDQKLEDFLVNTGRRKFLSPLYNELVKTPEGKHRAVEIYKKARPNYHFVATSTFDKLLQ